MSHELAGLVDRPGEAGSQHGGVESALQESNQHLAGLPVAVRGLVEGPAQLLLAEVVLEPQALLLFIDRPSELGCTN